MYMVNRSLKFVRGALLSYGPTKIKKLFWDKEFSSGKWNFIDNTAGDCVYGHLEKYAQNGSILDLGCGPGNTANELSETAYRNYVGVDISDAALAKARRRTEESGRANKNHFVQSDFLSYEPAQRFNVILFREAMYHIPVGKIREILDKYSQHLTDRGVFIVRMFLSENGKVKSRMMKMTDIIEANFEMVDRRQHGEPGPTIFVFRPKGPEQNH
jgi:SAM-dependent methyltransferase